MLPYITEEVWSWLFAQQTGSASIHRAAWPSEADFADLPAPADASSFAIAADCWRAINKAKADAEVSMGREVESLTIVARSSTLARLAPGLSDVLLAARCHAHELAEDTTLDDGAFAIRDATFAEKTAKA